MKILICIEGIVCFFCAVGPMGTTVCVRACVFMCVRVCLCVCFHAINSRRSYFFLGLLFFSFWYPAIYDADVSSKLERSQVRDPGSQA